MIEFSLSRNEDCGIEIKELESAALNMCVKVTWIITELKMLRKPVSQASDFYLIRIY